MRFRMIGVADDLVIARASLVVGANIVLMLEVKLTTICEAEFARRLKDELYLLLIPNFTVYLGLRIAFLLSMLRL